VRQSAMSLGGSGANSTWTQSATALKSDAAELPSSVNELHFSAPSSEPLDHKRLEARVKGYVGEACPECGNFTMVRNGTCLKCDTCGGTTGCS
jgi:ribonucleoside-diphosphate reductase alpha chain